MVGPNASGKTNILEAIYCLATGQSFRAETEQELIGIGNSLARIAGQTGSDELEMIWDGRERFHKLYKVNGVGKRQIDFVGNLRAVLFCPQDIEIVTDSPSTRRKYLDSVLSLVHRDYRIAISTYERAMRNRNKILWKIREFDFDGDLQLEYWDNLLIDNGRIIHQRRKEYLDFINNWETDFFPVTVHYDHSIISKERLEKYRSAEVAAAVTLVGPHRDEFTIYNLQFSNKRNIKTIGSRGEQRMAVFTMKLGELEYVRQQAVDSSPTLLLDDIFSELDHENRRRLLQVVPKQQTIMTTTDLHLVEKGYTKHVEIIELI